MADVLHDATLPTNLISYWKLDEESGNREDIHSTNDLTDNNTVLFGTGKQGNAADFERATTEYLSITEAAGPTLDIGGDISIACWIKLETLPTVALDVFSIIEKKDVDGSNVPYSFEISDSLNRLQFFYQGTGGTTLSLTDAAAFSGTEVWHHVVVTVDVSAAAIIFYVNGSAVADTNSLSNATDMKTVTNGNFIVGADHVNARYYLDGLIDELGVWSKILTAAEVTTLYGGGAGIPYDDPGITDPSFQLKSLRPRVFAPGLAR